MSFDKGRQARSKAIVNRCRDAKAAAVLQALADAYREDRKECCPAVSDLVGTTKLSRSSVNRAIELLEEDQLISIDRRFGARHYYTLHLDGQLVLRPGPRAVAEPRAKRETGFRVRPRRKTCVRVTQVSERKSDANLCQGDTGFSAESDTNRSQPEIGSCVTVTQVRDLPLCTPGSQVSTATGADRADGESQTATAAPRLPFPIALKPPRPAEQLAKLVEEHRLQKLRKRVAGYAVGLMLRPDGGRALIHEPIDSEAALLAATKELCRRKGVDRYGDVVVAMCCSVWWRHTLYGKAVIAGQAPRPRDRAKGRPRGT